MVMTARSRIMRPIAGLSILAAVRRFGRLVLGADIAAFDVEPAVMADADEGAGAGDVGGIEADGRSSKAASAVSISPRR